MNTRRTPSKCLRILVTAVVLTGNLFIVCIRNVQASGERSNANGVLCSNMLVGQRLSELPNGEFDPRKLPIFEDIQSLIEVAKLDPEFGAQFARVLETKKWRWDLDRKVIDNCPGDNALPQFVRGILTKVACHSDKYIDVDPMYFFDSTDPSRDCNDPALPGVLLSKQRYLIAWELLLGLKIDNDLKVTTDSLSKVLGQMMELDQQNQRAKRGEGVHPTVRQLRQALGPYFGNSAVSNRRSTAPEKKLAGNQELDLFVVEDWELDGMRAMIDLDRGTILAELDGAQCKLALQNGRFGKMRGIRLGIPEELTCFIVRFPSPPVAERSGRGKSQGPLNAGRTLPIMTPVSSSK